jgi:hypothetical protein
VVDGAIKKELRQKAGVELDVVPIVNDQLRRLLAAMDKYQELVVKPAVDEVEKQVEAELSGALLASLWSKVFAKIPLLEETSDLVHQVSRKMLVRWCDFPWNTGLVLAGYGSADIFPSVVSFRLDSMMMGKLRYVQGTGGKITFDNEAAILPFAQAEMVHEFMEGIDKSYVEMLGSAFEGALQGFGESLLDGLHYLRKTEKGLVKGKLEENARKMTEKLLNEFEAIRRENNVRPVLDAVAALPKPELATMAETLVGLTSFKRKMSTQTETVGGPVDVALISRGDGFVWVKRKRYFDPLLNSHFFQNYLDFECVLKGVDSDNAE